MLHDQNGFLVDDRPSATFVVVDNDGGGIFSFLPQARLSETFERAFGTPHGRSFESYAAFHGLRYRRIVAPDEVGPAVTGAQAEEGVALIHVTTERTANVVDHRRVTASVHEALDMLSF
jgi:2-succinyl-5-enolpyruvyl-6-hydroxy-3-cyclohexene-1-carboxylate synthase